MRIVLTTMTLMMMSASSLVHADERMAELIHIATLDKPALTHNAAALAQPAAKPEKTDPKPYIGQTETMRTKFEDTLLELGRAHNLGYVEMVAANPGVDPWLPGDRTKITLPKRHLIPDVERKGIVINLAEMRMYSFVDDPDNPETYPLGIGRDGLHTPKGLTQIKWKKEGPTWRPTARMRKEDPELPEVVPPGEDNPLGTHALYLGWPQYLIHGTHKPLGVGRRVSSGCIRMYPEDIITVFENTPVGTQVRVISQPVKLAWIDDMLYLEAHAEDELADSFEDIGTIKEYRVPETLFADLSNIAGEKKNQINWLRVREALKRRSGVPIAILNAQETDIEISEGVLDVDPDTPAPQDKPQPKKQEYKSHQRNWNG